MPKNNLAKIISQQRQYACEIASGVINDTFYVLTASIACELNRRGYKRAGIKNFMDGVFEYMNEFVEMAKGEYIDRNGYTKHTNLDYATTRFIQRQREIVGDEPLKYDITELVDLLTKRG